LDIFKDCPQGMAELFAGVRIGIAGCGGIGSNAAAMLARSGALDLVLADMDRVEPGNLNRQFFFADQIGLSKAGALAQNLKRINPKIRPVVHSVEVTPGNVPGLFGGCDVLMEAFDRCEAKAMLIEEWMSSCPQRPIVACSGVAGTGPHCRITVSRSGLLSMVGDGVAELSEGTFAARVTAVSSAMVAEVYHRLSGNLCDRGCCSPKPGSSTRIISRNEDMPLSGFPARMVENTIRGMLRTLKGVDAEGPLVVQLPGKKE
jgi:sulfur carrier protein ThiS adenylyltransferase